MTKSVAGHQITDALQEMHRCCDRMEFLLDGMIVRLESMQGRIDAVIALFEATPNRNGVNGDGL